MPFAIPRPPPGSKVVIVVGGGGSDGTGTAPTSAVAPLPTMLTGESQAKPSIVMFPTAASTLEQIKRQGHLNKLTEMNKQEKSQSNRFAKLLPSTPRHIAGGPSDIFQSQHKPFPGEKVLTTEKRAGPGPQILDFRPHQPDITQNIQNNNGKLSLPVMGFRDDTNGLGTGIGIGTPNPTPMANKLNPYTNGVAASFPPGIDPYEGFIRYAAENLDTPTGNIVDYHSLEHFYGPQHPLSPYHTSKEAGNLPNVPSYADSFSYNNGIETANSPPPPPPPPPGGPQSYEYDGPGSGPDIGDIPERGSGFRGRDDPLGGGGGSLRSNDHNQVEPSSPYAEHGIDHFHAPSPGMGAAPPRPRPPSSEPSNYEDEHGPGSSPYDSPSPGLPPFPPGPHGAPFKHLSSSAAAEIPNTLQDDDDRHPPRPPPHGHSPDPPDLDVFEEGPPPPGSHPPIPPPPNQLPSSNPEQANADVGDDAIWGILDLAEMLEKGNFPGQGNTAADGKAQASPQIGPDGRVVVPIFTRPRPPKSPGSSSPAEDHLDGDPDASPPHIPPPPASMLPANSQKNSYAANGQGGSDGGFDYDDNPEPAGGRPYGGSLDSQEANDYGDDVYSK